MQTNERVPGTSAIYTKIFIWFSVIGVVLLSASSLWTYHTMNQLFQVTKERREVALVEGAALAIGDLIATRSYAQLEVSLRYLMGNDAVHAVVVTDLEGDVLAALERAPDSQKVVLNYSMTRLVPPSGLAAEYLTQKHGDQVFLWYRLDPGYPLGWIRLESNTVQDDALLENLRLNIMLSVVILFISLFGASIGLFYRAKKKTQSAENRLLERNKALHSVAHMDALTQLPNRLSLKTLTQEAMSSASERGLLLAVCFLDMDGFKEVNDRLGHQSGDQLLIAAARRMKKVMRESDSVIRLSGDEFVLLLGGIHHEGDLSASVGRILGAVASPFTIEGEVVTISASIGVSLYPTNGASVDELVAQADSAMYQAKRQGKNTWVRFKPK